MSGYNPSFATPRSVAMPVAVRPSSSSSSVSSSTSSPSPAITAAERRIGTFAHPAPVTAAVPRSGSGVTRPVSTMTSRPSAASSTSATQPGSKAHSTTRTTTNDTLGDPTPKSFHRRSRGFRRQLRQDILKRHGPPRTPSRAILESSDMATWERSETYLSLVEFIWALNESILKTKTSDAVHESETVKRILEILAPLSTWIDEIPPADNNSRFGNKSFRVWHARLEENATAMLERILPPEKASYAEELKAYLITSFGHPTRIDYGSGHELSFATWLCALESLDLVSEEDYAALVLRVFVLKLQTVYKLEPAGSHGVWGLDDYQFLPFLWGSAQLIDHAHIKPKSIMNRDIVETFAKEYVYLGGINFIQQIKKGPFHEHSPMLYDISGVASWAKVNSGLMKMYLVEVLGKFPVVQHMVFGSLLPWEDANEEPAVVESFPSSSPSSSRSTIAA